MRIGTPRYFWITGEKIRTMRSVAPPAAHGTMISISLVGNFSFGCAPRHKVLRSKSTEIKSTAFFAFIGNLLKYVVGTLVPS